MYKCIELKGPKPIKGIPLDQLKPEKSLVTTQELVQKFFEDHPGEAFTIEMLQEGARFSTNIRKIIQSLKDKGILTQVSQKPPDKDKWEYYYYLRPLGSKFELKKTDDGWKITAITLDGDQFAVTCETEEEPPSDDFEKSVIRVGLEFPEGGDAILYFDEVDNSSEEQIDDPDGEAEEILWRGTIQYSVNEEFFDNFARRVDIYQECDELWDLEVDSPGKRSRISVTKSIIESDRAILWGGEVGFLFIVDSVTQTLRIYPRSRKLDADGNLQDEEGVNYYDEGYGKGKRNLGEILDFVGMGEFNDESYENDIMKEEGCFVVMKAKK